MIENGGEREGRGGRKGRWGRRFGIALCVCLAAMFLAHVTWSFTTGHGVKSRIRALKAAGEPILPADFATPPDGPDNGGTIILAIGDAVDQYRKSHSEPPDWDPDLPLRPEERKQIERSLADLAPQLAQLQQTVARPRHDWNLDLTPPLLMKVMLPEMNGQRALVNLLAEAATLDHTNGDETSALRRLDDIVFIARFIDRHPSLVGHLVSIGCTAVACDRIYDLAPDLKVGAAAGEVPPQDLRKMIDLLLDDAPLQAGLKTRCGGSA